MRTISRITVDRRLALPSGTIPSVLFSRKSLEEAGFNHITGALEQLPSATIARPNGGAPNAVAVVALRGPDPSETLVALDGQILNNTNTGDLDLSQFPISPFRAIEVTERLGPESASAANTIGGEVNLQSLAPTRDSHAMASFSYGSFNAATLAANATGSAGHIGYTFALGNATTQGFARDDAANFDNADGTTTRRQLDSGVTTRTALANLQRTFAQGRDLRVRYFTIADRRDESAALRYLSAFVSANGQRKLNSIAGHRKGVLEVLSLRMDFRKGWRTHAKASFGLRLEDHRIRNRFHEK